ncbi:MAG: acetate--CoA ligase family protein [Ignavibacteriales bacterium]|nr:acetate--CoA ligase family protein [Ignavibacteriales bacterium]
MNSLKNFFYPKSICVVGASTKEKNIGYELLNTIKSYGFRGSVFPVNPKAEEILGYKCYKRIEEISEKIDLAIVVVPKQFVETSIDELLAKNVKAIVLITAGFREIGKEGEELENRIVEKIKNFGAQMVGPNCMGIINTLENIKLNATFVAEKPETGNTGFLSQSGALGAAVLNSLRETDIKFAHFISVGNKADVNENDLLDFWQNDSNIKTLTFYLESFINGENFIKPFITGIITKPAIVLKAGKTASGMKAASSHTGALSSKDKVVDALMKQFGIIRVSDLNELFNTAKGFENFPMPKGNRVAVVTNAGGPGILAVDTLERENLVLTTFSNETKKLLRGIVHPEGSVENPVDLLPGADASVFKRAIGIIIEDGNVDAVISIFVEPVMVAPFEIVENINSIQSKKPILQVVMPLPEFWNKYRKESSSKCPLFKNPEDPPKVLSNMLFYSSSQKKILENKKKYESLLRLKPKKNSCASGFLPQNEITKLCEKYSLPLIKSRLIKPLELNSIGNNFFPLVLKGINSKVIHKTELSAVKLNIKNRIELRKAAKEIKESFSKSGYDIENFLVQGFVKTKHEILIGGFRDASFGPVIMFGAGGKYVEIISDTAIRSAYLCDRDINHMINETVIGKILRGIRGEEPCDMIELKRIILSCARMMIENKTIVEFDLNPLIVGEDNKYYGVDVRVCVE